MRLAFGLIALGMLTACDGGGDPVQQALRETAAANHAAATKTTAEAEAAPATGAAADRAWIERTLADHRRTIASAEALLARTDDPEVRRTAENLIADRRQEIAQLEVLAATE